MESVGGVKNENGDLSKGYNMSKDFENVPKSKGNTLCPMPWNSINLRNNGDLRICCNTNSYSRSTWHNEERRWYSL